jgi:hypothetical protein
LASSRASTTKFAGTLFEPGRLFVVKVKGDGHVDFSICQREVLPTQILIEARNAAH